jgi:hypothetical protein
VRGVSRGGFLAVGLSFAAFLKILPERGWLLLQELDSRFRPGTGFDCANKRHPARSRAGSSGCPLRAESERPIRDPIKASRSCQVLGLTAAGAGLGGAGTGGEGASEAPGAGVGGGGVGEIGAAGAAAAGVSGAGVAGAPYDGEEAAAPWPGVIGVS